MYVFFNVHLFRIVPNYIFVLLNNYLHESKNFICLLENAFNELASSRIGKKTALKTGSVSFKARHGYRMDLHKRLSI
jgi:hypothetical protein